MTLVKTLVEKGTLVTEASAESKSGKRFRAKIIEAGQGSSAFYPARVLEDYASVFKPGTQMFFDHPSLSEDWERPERTVKDLVGKLVTEAVYSPVDEALYADVEFYSWVAPILEEMKDDIGLSIRAFGTAEESGDADAPTPVLTSFVEVLSVDVVTRAGAGGALLEMMESARESSLADIKNVAETNKENFMNEAQEALLKQVAESIQNLTAALTPVVEAHEAAVAAKEAEKSAADKPAETDPLDVANALAASDLTVAGREAALARVKAGVALDEAIKAQVEYEKSVAEAAKAAVRNPGFKINDETSKVGESAPANKGFNGFKKVGN